MVKDPVDPEKDRVFRVPKGVKPASRCVDTNPEDVCGILGGMSSMC